eukprot:scaffold1518_cov417-Prasinococcus_capsulatus_cf.AAC.2
MGSHVASAREVEVVRNDRRSGVPPIRSLLDYRRLCPEERALEGPTPHPAVKQNQRLTTQRQSSLLASRTLHGDPRVETALSCPLVHRVDDCRKEGMHA